MRTAAGARVGMSFAEVDAIYHGYGKLITNDQGHTAYVVAVGPMVLLFGDHPIRPGVGSIQAGLDAVSLVVGPQPTEQRGEIGVGHRAAGRGRRRPQVVARALEQAEPPRRAGPAGEQR